MSHPLRENFRSAPTHAVRGDRMGFAAVLRKSPLAYGAFVVMSLIVLGAVFAPLMSPYDKDKIDLTSQYLAPVARPSLRHRRPRARHFRARDARRPYFARGGLSGHDAGTPDGCERRRCRGLLRRLGGHACIMRAVDLMLAVPVFFVILFLTSILSPRISVLALCLMIGCTQWMEVARLVRAGGDHHQGA